MRKHNATEHDVYVLAETHMPERFSNKIPHKSEILFFRAKKGWHRFPNRKSRLLQWKFYPHKGCFIIRTPIFQFEHNHGQVIIGGWDNFICWNPWAQRAIKLAKKEDRILRRIERKVGC